ncbi:MAG: zinc metallopeptidase, partial [Phycisphaerales bacterium]|nr:zinc metallopeptidase [Phycisphaerales bacterium]
MRWEGRRRSDNVQDRRRMGAGGFAGGGIGILVLALIVYFLGGDPTALLDQSGALGPQSNQQAAAPPEDDAAAAFVSVVLADTEDVWNALFDASGRRYIEPQLVLFRGQTQSACGFASAATGPFYCPADEQVYIDLSFFDELDQRFGAPGDFAQAYVVAHEVGHHVQRLLGITEKVHSQRGRVSEADYNDLSVRLELQADFLAGVWAHHAQRTKRILEPGDIDEALQAATAIGDDRLQRRAQGYVVPETFTHGTSAQRAKWFRLGFETGDMAKGDTFSIPTP